MFLVETLTKTSTRPSCAAGTHRLALNRRTLSAALRGEHDHPALNMTVKCSMQFSLFVRVDIRVAFLSNFPGPVRSRAPNHDEDESGDATKLDRRVL